MDFKKVQKFAGNVCEKDMELIDYYIGKDMGVFVPNGGLFEYAMDSHNLPTYLFCFIYHNRTCVNIEGKVIPVKPGELIAISPNVEHYEEPVDMQSRYYAICITAQKFEKVFGELSEEELKVFKGAYFELPSNLPLILKEFIKECISKTPGHANVTQSLENVIIYQIVRSVLNIQSNNKIKRYRFEVEKAIEYMHQNIHEKIRLSDIACDVGMSSSQLSKIFKEEVGVSPMRYLNEIRLERGRRMLLMRQVNVTEIIHECGFSSVSYFTSQFKKIYKMTPTEYRDRLSCS